MIVIDNVTNTSLFASLRFASIFQTNIFKLISLDGSGSSSDIDLRSMSLNLADGKSTVFYFVPQANKPLRYSDNAVPDFCRHMATQDTAITYIDAGE